MQLLLINDVTFYGHIQINVKRIYLENDLWDDIKKEILLKVSETESPYPDQIFTMTLTAR